MKASIAHTHTHTHKSEVFPSRSGAAAWSWLRRGLGTPARRRASPWPPETWPWRGPGPPFRCWRPAPLGRPALIYPFPEAPQHPLKINFFMGVILPFTCLRAQVCGLD